MLIELRISNYATFNGFVNEANGILKTSTKYCENHYMGNVSEFLNWNTKKRKI